MKSSDRLLNLLRLFSTDRTLWSVEEAALELQLSVSNTYRYFRSLVAAGFIVPIASGRYVLGPAIIQLDRQMRLRDPLITAASPLMRAMVAAAPEQSVAILCRYSAGQAICVHEELVRRPLLALSYERGLPMPIWRGAASKALLAHLPLRTVRALRAGHEEEFARYGLGADWAQVKARLRALRAQPAIYTERELDTPTAGFAAAIFEDGHLAGSLGLVCLIDHVVPRDIARLLHTAVRVAAEIESALAEKAGVNT